MHKVLKSFQKQAIYTGLTERSCIYHDIEVPFPVIWNAFLKVQYGLQYVNKHVNICCAAGCISECIC